MSLLGAMEIVSERENRLVGRKEVVLVVDHMGAGTPKRSELREVLAKKYSVPVENVFITRILSEYGMGRSRVWARIYESKERAREIEPEHVLRRHGEVGEEPQAGEE